MEKGALVWCRDEDGDEAWLQCEVVSKSIDELTLKEKNKSSAKPFTRGVETLNEETGERKFKGVELANTPLSKEDKEEGLDNDLIALPHLHEPAILHALSDRFFRGKIYTWTGPVLIAVNPFQRLQLYTNEILEEYRRDGLLKAQGMQSGTELEPHIFAIADHSYRQMMREERRSQSILISGESGAGKTESTKIVMLYLTTLGAGSASVDIESEDSGEMSVMQRVLQSNPILEAFGNARTLRNDNSSRFGKFIELGFSRSGQLLGAKVQTYLLEKVRLAFHAAGERNYHIFYQLLRGCSDEDHHKYEFHEGLTGGLDLPNYFHYTGQGGAPHLREFTDESGLEYTLKAMRKLGWSQETIESVMHIIAGLLHLGQIKFNSVDKEGNDAAEVADEKVLAYTARLIGVDVDKLRSALTERIMLARGEEIRTMMEPSKAADARDALAKTIYGALFLWVVDQVNISVGWKNDNDVRSSCGVLDIFGFECFAINSFEQLCINYTNEALQQQFNQFIFKLEQAEYESENIEWAFIEFPDNQDCLDTIQAPINGILATLDDECRLPKGSDRNFAKRLYDQYLPAKNQFVSDNTRFHATNMQKGKALFCIRHFAGLVEYSVETNFMEKNRDEIPITAKNMFETAPSQLIQDTYAIQTRDNDDRAGTGQGKGGRAPKQKTVGQQFKEQLLTLIENVQKTDPHYIRCIKPNDAAKPLVLTRKRTTEQLRYGGVLEAVRVARAGYPVRLLHVAFFQRYRMILPTTPDKELPWSMDEQEAQKLCIKLVECALNEGKKQQEITRNGPLNPNEEGITRSEKIRRMQSQPMPMLFPKSDVQLGKTKVFMRKHPHDCLEAHRVFHQHASATVMQCWARGLAQQRKLYIIQSAVETVQRCYRGCKGRERWWKIRKDKAGMLLTKVFRMLIKWRSYTRARIGTIRMQARVRGYNVRRVFAATTVQKYYKRFIARKHFKMMKKAIIALQCRTRQIQAKNLMMSFKKEQKDVGKLKQNNERLKQEMASLRAMLAAQAKESAADAAHTKEMAEKEKIIEGLEKRIAEIEKELAEARATLANLEEKIQKQDEESAKDKDQLQKLRRHRPSVSASSTRVTDSPQARRRRNLSSEIVPPPPPLGGGSTASIPGGQSILEDEAIYLNPEVLSEHRAKVAILEDELDAERALRLEADGEIIRLRAAINGVHLNEKEVNDLLVQKVDNSVPALRSETMSEDSYDGTSTVPSKRADTQSSSATEHVKEGRSPEVQHALEKLGIQEEKEREKIGFVDSLRASADFIPRIRRGFTTAEEKEEEDVVAVGWKTEIRNRREREEALRDGVHKFEARMKKFIHVLEEGIEVVMWQLNRGSPDMAGETATEEFALKASNVSVKMHRRGDLYVQAVLNFMLRGGYLSKTIGRNRNVDKTALEPLSLHDILEVRAGCSGFDHTELPTATGKTKTKKGSKTSKVSKSENKQTSLFMTIKATPTPVASSRSYIFRFKSRSARNDVMNALRSILADMQIKEGVSVSGLHTEKDTEEDDREEIMVPLSAVHEVMNRERESYDRILLMFLQGNEDVKEKEDELLSLRDKLESVFNESKEKDRVQANDSKLIMQLSKKLENLLMDNEDLRDQNDRLNTRLVSVEADAMNNSGRG